MVANAVKLAACLDALRPILYIENADFGAVDELIRTATAGERVVEYNHGAGGVDFETKVPLSESGVVWCGGYGVGGADGLAAFLNNYISDVPMRRVLVLKDVHDELADCRIVAKLKTIAERTATIEGYWVPVVVVSAVRKIPRELEPLITFFDIDNPTREEVSDLLDSYAKEYAFPLDPKVRDELSLAFKGLSEFEIRQILNLAYQNDGVVDLDDMPLILKEKEQSIRKGGLLEAVRLNHDVADIGGLDNLVSYLKSKAEVFSNLSEALKFGVDVPKGILIVGMPGCGKSLTAKVCASLFKMPLLRLDVGRLLGKYVGESEANLRRAIRQAEAATPCVLWIDEIEKAFAGIGRDEGGGGVTTRLFGCFLTWMQEKDSSVYVVATANDLTGIPPEFLRRGRFDEIFSVALPSREERRRIFEIHLGKRKKDWHKLKLDLVELVDQTQGSNGAEYSGADIESIVKRAIEQAFSRRHKMQESGDVDWRTHDVTQEDLLSAIRHTIPIKKTMAEKIEQLENGLKKYQVVKASGDLGDK